MSVSKRKPSRSDFTHPIYVVLSYIMIEAGVYSAYDLVPSQGSVHAFETGFHIPLVDSHAGCGCGMLVGWVRVGRVCEVCCDSSLG